MTTCKGIVLSTKKPCIYDAKENGFCGRHQSQTFMETAKTAGKTVCRHFERGCRNYISEDDIRGKITSCSECRSKILGKEKQCSHHECPHKIPEDEEYCGKHYRDYYYKKAKEEGINYCNIERGCNTILAEGEKICKQCIERQNDKIEKELEGFRTKHELCLECNTKKKLCGHFCRECSLSVRYVKDKAGRRLIYNVWNDHVRGIGGRSLYTTLKYNDFLNLVIRPCFYCGKFSDNRYNGIDRYYNDIGYTEANSKPCCSECNLMKNDYKPELFLRKVNAIACFQTFGRSEMNELVELYPELQCIRSTTYISYKNNAISRRKLEFTLTKEEFDKFKYGQCYLCGLNYSEKHRNGIDRVDSSKDYTIDNCRPCCGVCNGMKLEQSLNEFVNQCRQIVKHNRPLIETIVRATKFPSETTTAAEKEKIFTAAEIYDLMEKDHLSQYIDWAKKVGKTPQFVAGILNIDWAILGKEATINEIRHQMEMERTRIHKNSQEGKVTKHFTAISLYGILVAGEKDKFTRSYEKIFGLSQSYHAKYEELAEEVPKQSRNDAIELCKKFLRAEKSRRQSMNAVGVKSDSSKTMHERKDWKAYDIHTPKIPEPENELVFDAPVPIPEITVTSSTTTTPKQWKATLIYDYIKSGKGNLYKSHCETNNTITEKDKWEADWKLLVGTVIVAESFDAVKETISKFIVALRSVRHDTLLHKNKKDVLERTDRQVWPKETIMKAWKEGKIHSYKEYLDNADKDLLVSRWPRFLESLEKAYSDTALLNIIQKFQTTLRTARYRSS